MNNGEEFAPPAEVSTQGGLGTNVIAAWMLSGAAVGISIGITGQVIGGYDGLATILTGVFSVGGAIAGLIAFRVERNLSADRPALINASGTLSRPTHGALYAIPIVAAVPALAWLVVVGSVATASLLPAVVFGMGGFTLGWAARRVFASHSMTAALEALEAGEVEEAKRRLRSVEAGWLSTKGSRTTARLNLGMLALSHGDLDAAAEFYSQVYTGPGAAFAAVGLALVRVLQDRLDEAQQAVMLAMEGGQAVQGQVDAVRLLLVMRLEGDEAAHGLGERLFSAESGELFRGLLGLLRLRTGDATGAKTLVDTQTQNALEESGWGRLIPEIAEMLATPEFA